METFNRNKAGMLRKIQAGVFPGCAPLGYRNRRTTLDDAWIEPEPDTAPLVREAFRLMAKKRSSVRKVLAQVTEMGLRSRNGNPIHPSPFHRMLQNTFYVGEVRFDGETFPGSHPPLVSRRLFDTVQERLRGRRKA